VIFTVPFGGKVEVVTELVTGPVVAATTGTTAQSARMPEAVLPQIATNSRSRAAA
jgi:hypothetical protein